MPSCKLRIFLQIANREKILVGDQTCPLSRNLDAELELKGRLEAYVAKRIQWEENRHVKAGKEPFHLQFIGT